MISVVRNRCTQTHRTQINFSGVHYRTHHVGNSKGNRLSWVPSRCDATLWGCSLAELHPSLTNSSSSVSWLYLPIVLTLIPPKHSPSLYLPLSLSLTFPSLMFGSVPRMADVVPAAPQSVQPAGPLKSFSALFSPCPVGLRGGTQIVNDWLTATFSPPISPSWFCLFLMYLMFSRVDG